MKTAKLISVTVSIEGQTLDIAHYEFKATTGGLKYNDLFIPIATPDRAELLAALQKVDANLKHVPDYESGWLNYPDKPEISLADMCRGLMAKYKAGKGDWMSKIITVKSCGECPYIGIEKQPPLKCLCAPSDNYGTVIDDILEIPAWCPLTDDADHDELLAALEAIANKKGPLNFTALKMKQIARNAIKEHKAGKEG